MTWQKHARFGIAAFVIVFVAIVVVALRQRKAPVTPAPAPPRIDKTSLSEITGGLVNELFNKDGKLVYSVKAEQQVVYADNRTKLLRVAVTLPDRNGRTFVVTANEAEVIKKPEQQLGTVQMTGDVRLKTSDGTKVASDTATYDDEAGLVAIPGAVTFTRGRMKGKGVGATYDRNRDVLWLLDQAHITLAAAAKGQGALDATAGAAGMARADHYIKLTRNGHINAEGRLIDADEIMILLTPGSPDSNADNNNDQRVQMLQLRGNSRIDGGGAANAPQAMSARDIDLTYGDDGRTLQHAQLMENGVLQLPDDGRSGGPRVEAKTIDIALAPDGATVTNLNATGNVQLDLPADGDLPAKRIKASTLIASGPAGAGLQSLTFGGGVDYRETRAARRNLPAEDRGARSLTLIVETKPGLGALQEADFHGNVHFTDGPQVSADAPRALYHVDRDQIDLSPSDDPGPASSRVTDGRVTVEARTIEFALSTRKLKADTKVRSSMLPRQKPDGRSGTGASPAAGTPRGTAAGRAGAPPAATARGAATATATASAPATTSAATHPSGAATTGSDQGHLPSILKQDQPVTVTSNRLAYDGDVGHAVYSGNARLWQGDTTIRGDTVIVDDKTGNLEARINVHTEMTLDEVDTKTKARKATRTVGDSEAFVYDDAKRLTTYTGNAHLVGPGGDVAAEKIELFLKPGANELDRAEGYGANGTVIVKENTRTAIGARLTYTADTETYLMTGTPVEVVQNTPPACKKSVSAVVTFHRGVDAVSMAGNGVIRSVQNPIVCPAEPR